MDKDEQKKLNNDVERAVYESMSDPRYWARKRAKWDEWGSPVGLTLAWAIFVVSSAFVIYLLHLSGLI
jgi:hypothetical protein